MSNAALFKQGMRLMPGAVTVVTTRGPSGERRGVTATAICSLSVDPPAIVACINRETWVGQFAPVSRIFCVNMLALAQREVAATFAGRSGHVGEDRFQVGDWAELDTGSPALRGAVASFDCRLERAIEFASHVVLIGEVATTVLGAAALEPLIYFEGAFTTPVSQARAQGERS